MFTSNGLMCFNGLSMCKIFLATHFPLVDRREGIALHERAVIKSFADDNV